MAPHLPASRRQLSWLAGTFLSIFVLLLVFWHNQEAVRRVVSASYHSVVAHNGPLQCHELPGADDVMVVMKTGASEVQDKLSVHLRTTLRCYPNHIIFSDYDEVLPTGEHLHDALQHVSSEIRETSPDFQFWRKLRAESRAGLTSEDLSGDDSREIPEPERMKIPGWKLDKWKFLPMLNQTLHMYPDKPWYVFVEGDTYIFWSNLLAYLAEHASTSNTAAYIGFRTGIEDVSFAHGGSGFLVSRPALERVVNEFENNKAEWEDYTDRYWVGDHILGAAFRKAGVWLTNASPSWQGDPVGLLRFSPSNTHEWCSTVMTLHHESPAEIENLWKLEQTWILQTNASAGESRPFRRRDLFEHYVLPRMQEPLSDWDNQANALQERFAASRQECETACEQDSGCMQYAFNGGNCTITSNIIYGQSAEGVESGWMFQRIQKQFEESSGC